MIRWPAAMLLLVVGGCSSSSPTRTDGGRNDGDQIDGRSDVPPGRDGAPDTALQPAGPAVAFQVDVAHTGNQTASTLTPPLTRAWSVDIGASTDFLSYPLIVDGRVFVTSQSPTSSSSTLRALDLATGTVVWGPVDIGGIDMWSNAAYDDGRVYVVIRTGVLTAFDAATGVTVWSKQLPGQNDFSSPPTAAGGMVFVGGAGLGGTVYGVDGASGTVVWSADVLGGDVSSPALSADAVFVSYACVQTYSFSRTDGTPIWHHDGGCVGAGGATPALWQESLWARDSASSANLVLDATSGAERGSFSAIVIPAFAGQRGFFLADGTLQALDVGTQAPLWNFAGDGTLASAPLVVNAVVYIGSSNGQLYALDPATGTMLWSDTLPSGVSMSYEQGLATVGGLGAGGNALVVPAGNHLVCYR